MFARSLPNPARPVVSEHLFALFAMTILLAALLPVGWAAITPASQQPHAHPSLGNLPLSFMPTNNPATPFIASGLGGSLAFQAGAITLALPDTQLTVRFVGAHPDAAVLPAARRPGVFNSHIGNDPARWRSNIPTYAAVIEQGLYAGVDLRYNGRLGQLKGTYTVAPQADPLAIRWRYEGAQQVAIDAASGDLRITLPGGASLTEHAPVAWQDLAGQRVPVQARFALDGNTARFELGSYNRAQPLVIDPTLVVGSYLGGGSADYGRGIALDPQGNIYVVGDFFSSDFLGGDTKTHGSKDVIILKLNPTGTDMIYGSFLGGTGTDEGLAIAVNPAGEAFVLSDPDTDFPVDIDAPISTPPAVGDGVLTKLNAAGQSVYSTYIGFGLSNIFTGNAIALDANGVVYITGESYIAIQRRRELAVAIFNSATGAAIKTYVTQSTFLGSRGAAIALGPDKTIYITGTTDSPFGTDFSATPGAFQTICGRKQSLGAGRDCDSDAFVIAFSQDLAVTYASYLGRNGGDEGRGIAVDGAGNVIVAGTTFSSDFPVKHAIQTACPIDGDGCTYDSFVTKFAPNHSLVYSSYLTSSEPESWTTATDVAVDQAGNAYVYGFTNGIAIPIKNAVQPERSTGLCLGAFDRFCFDAFVTELAPDGSLVFGTYLGGALDEFSGGIAVDKAGAIYLVGYTESSNFPVSQGSIQPAKSVGKDFFVAKIGAGAAQGGPELTHKVYVSLVKR